MIGKANTVDIIKEINMYWARKVRVGCLAGHSGEELMNRLEEQKSSRLKTVAYRHL